jgi:hypothetical protein
MKEADIDKDVTEPSSNARISALEKEVASLRDTLAALAYLVDTEKADSAMVAILDARVTGMEI